ncbi:hypothetical protein BDV26DRAFT_253579 [Aspergillus bertholletiae]|uniref:Uncharacterized protein n=1 Tax=Aspergillus bertholletiae TaxID=1226010 RepID=A0A5N7BLU9_9EURO|nr:hypothetical protein BDV26DRAFT_253579 [Aspergillus bertholletiae]
MAGKKYKESVSFDSTYGPWQPSLRPVRGYAQSPNNSEYGTDVRYGMITSSDPARKNPMTRGDFAKEDPVLSFKKEIARTMNTHPSLTDQGI